VLTGSFKKVFARQCCLPRHFPVRGLRALKTAQVVPSGDARVALLHLLARRLIERIDEQVAAHIPEIVARRF
jgi:hypothetical protein